MEEETQQRENREDDRPLMRGRGKRLTVNLTATRLEGRRQKGRCSSRSSPRFSGSVRETA